MRFALGAHTLLGELDMLVAYLPTLVSHQEINVSSECVLSLGTSDVIAVLAALVAGLSALYARWAAEEAKRANELALLPPRKAIYDAFHELKTHMTQKGLHPDIEQVSKFYNPSRDATFYVKESLSDELANYYALCFKVADLSRLGNRLYPHEDDEMKIAFNKALAISEEIDEALRLVLKKYAANG